MDKYWFISIVYDIIYHYTNPSYSVFMQHWVRGIFFLGLEIGEFWYYNPKLADEIKHPCMIFALYIQKQLEAKFVLLAETL